MGAKNEVIAFSLQKKVHFEGSTDREHMCRSQKTTDVKNADFLGSISKTKALRILAHRTSKIMRVNIM